MARVLVLGARGQVGRLLPPAFAGHEVLALGHAEADLRDRAALDRVVAGFKPDAVVCAAAHANPDYCEEHPGDAYAVNIDGARNAAEASRGAAFAIYSTDHVFDGKKGPYTEDDRPAPINVYGRTKMEMERIVLTVHPRALVIRTALVFALGDRSFFSRLRAAKEAVPCWTDQRGTPTWGPSLAAATAELLLGGASGLWHVAGTETLSRHEFAVKVAVRFGLDPSLLRPCPLREAPPRAARPLDAGLSVAKAAAALKTELLPVDEALERAWRAHGPRGA
jgi:dTDP-4-dehydrorhamnose reductase